MSSINNGSLFNSIQLNLAILLISTSGALGKYIAVPIPITIGSRAFIAALLLFVFIKWKKQKATVNNEDRVVIYTGGLLMGIHWITYFYALQLSNVAIGMLSLYTYPVITAILEPLILKTKIQKHHVLLALVILIGIYCLVPEFDIQNDHFKAIISGVFSATCYALRNIIMKAKVEKYNGAVLMLNQLVVVSIFCIPMFFILDTSKVITYLPYTLVLAFLTTAVGHTLFVYSFKHFSAVSASIMSCLQPVYGIIIGLLFLGEIPGYNTVVGGTVILIAVIVESVRSYNQKRLIK